MKNLLAILIGFLVGICAVEAVVVMGVKWLWNRVKRGIKNSGGM